jgi:hypothetical protein
MCCDVVRWLAANLSLWAHVAMEIRPRARPGPKVFTFPQAYNQFHMSWDRCHKTFEFQQTSISAAPVQCCVPFLVRFDVFFVDATLIGGRGCGIVCKKIVMIHLQSKTTCVPKTSESDCKPPVVASPDFLAKVCLHCQNKASSVNTTLHSR